MIPHEHQWLFWDTRLDQIAPFRGLNLFFGGVQAVERDPLTGEVTGGGDLRRGGVAVAA